MKVATVVICDNTADSIINSYMDLEEKLQGQPDYLFLSCSVEFDVTPLLRFFKENCPGIAIHGGTSCKGVVTEESSIGLGLGGLAMLGIKDSEGRYGVGMAPIGEDPIGAAKQAVEQALLFANCPGEVPVQILLTSAPGVEEQVIQGIEELLGEDVPIVGGSSADNTVSGEWQQYGNHDVGRNCVVISVLFPSVDIFCAFHNGYEPTSMRGVVTRVGEGDIEVKGSRELYEIDGMPATQVYNNWTGGSISEQIEAGGNILSQTTLNPLGRVAGMIGEIPFYQLSHPDSVNADGALTLFTDISEGETLVLMKGTLDSLIARSSRVVTSAIETNTIDIKDIAGVLLIYCAGCLLAVGERWDEVVDDFRKVLPGIPFLGSFTFGEQGYFLNGGNRHGNLMISVLLISK